MENVFDSEWDRKCRDLTPPCPSPPLFNSFPKIYTKINENRGGMGVEGDPPM